MSLPPIPALPSIPASNTVPAGPSANPAQATSLGADALNQAVQGFGTKSITSAIFGLDVNRTIAIVLGLILIAGGIVLFRPVRDTIVETAKTAGKAAAA